MTRYVDVILALPTDKSFSYAVPLKWKSEVQVGCRVLVPFHRRTLTGFVVKLRSRRPSVNLKYKEILRVLDETPTFTPEALDYFRKLSSYFYGYWGEMLEASLPPALSLKSRFRFSCTDEGREALEGKELGQEELDILSTICKGTYTPVHLKRTLKIKNLSARLTKLEKKGLIRKTDERPAQKPRKRKVRKASPLPTQLEMDFSQDRDSWAKANAILDGRRPGVFKSVSLLGSRQQRERVYFFLLRKILESSGTALLMYPEISLSGPILESLETKFGTQAALLHSRLTARQREEEWRRIRSGDVRVVIGPRSALLAPLPDPDLIVVDDEEDESYLQKENPVYDARMGARLKGRRASSLLIFGSSAPSVENLFRSRRGGQVVRLESDVSGRPGTVIDSRSQKAIIAPRLTRQLKAILEQGEQGLILFNRRGYAPLLVCSRCDYSPRCHQCDITLTYHRSSNRMICHYCNDSISVPSRCPRCGFRILRKRGFGIEAAAEELRRSLTGRSIEVFDTDTARSMTEQSRLISGFNTGRIDVLIGTRFMAHRMDLSSAAFVAVLHPESVLALPDYQAGQKAYQNIDRMRRLIKRGPDSTFLIQTFLPDHHSIRCGAEGDYGTFYEKELELRRLLHYPPFSILVEVLFRGGNLRTLGQETRAFIEKIESCGAGIEILGPALAPVSTVRGQRRVQVLLKAEKKSALDSVLKDVLPGIKGRRSVLLYE